MNSFVPQRVPDEGSRERERERDRRAEGNGDINSLRRLEANHPPWGLQGQRRQEPEDEGRNEERTAGQEDAEESDSGNGSEPRDVFLPFIQRTHSSPRSQNSSSTSPSPVRGISEYFSWISNPSSDGLYHSSVDLVRHSPEPVNLHEVGYESTIVDDDSTSEAVMATGMPIPRLPPLFGHPWTRPTMIEEQWLREQEVLERREHLRIARQSIARGPRAEGNHGEDEEDEEEEEEENRLQEYRIQYTFLD